MFSFPDFLDPTYYLTSSETSTVVIQACIVAFIIGLWVALLSYRSALKTQSATFFWSGNMSLIYALWNIFFLSSYAQRDLDILNTTFSTDFTHRAYLVLACMLPGAVHACFRRIYKLRNLVSNRMNALALLLAIFAIFADSTGQIFLLTLGIGIFSFGSLAWINWKIWKIYKRSIDLRLKTRSLFLGLGLSLSIGFSILGQLRAESVLPLPVPYLGNIITVIFSFFVYQIIRTPRLREIRELMLRGIRVILLTFVLSAIFVSLLVWVGENDPELFVFNTFLASFIILTVLEPIRNQLDRYILRKFILDRYELEKIVQSILRRLRRVKNTRQLTSTLLMGIQESTRIYQTGFYLWNFSTQKYQLASKSNLSVPQLLQADHPLIQYFHETKAELAQDPSDDQRAQKLIRTLKSHLAFPIYQKDEILGLWLIRISLSDKNPYISFSNYELNLLFRLLQEVGTTLEQLRFFERQDQQQRLAALGEMSAALAHEIRNPLGAIQGAASLLKTSPSLKAEEDKECVQVLSDELERLQSTVDQYLHFARRSEKPSPIDISELIQAAVNASKTKAERTKTAIHFESRPELKLQIETDRRKLEQVLINLVENACEAFSKNVWIRASKFNEGGQEVVQIRVQDDGPGIPPNALPNIFTPLFTTKRAGSGLGLPICKKIIDSLGGLLKVESRLQKGSTFIVEFRRDKTTQESSDEAEPVRN